MCEHACWATGRMGGGPAGGQPASILAKGISIEIQHHWTTVTSKGPRDSRLRSAAVMQSITGVARGVTKAELEAPVHVRIKKRVIAAICVSFVKWEIS